MRPGDHPRLLYRHQASTATTPEEKIAIASAIEVKLAGRVGNPDLKPISPNLGELPKGETATIAAESIGMKPETYRKAKTIFSEADDETTHKTRF